MSGFNAEIQRVLSFWFGKIENGLSSDDKKRMWYQSDPDTDRLITSEFGVLHKCAVAGELDEWKSSQHGSMALIVILDQMSRNMFRGSGDAFASDPLALEICLYGIKQGYDKQLTLIERAFYYHPLEHSESLENQELCVSLMQALVDEHEGLQKAFAENALNFAIEHRDIIAEFGRFPYRNAVLGRENTAEEEQYLSGGGKRFGQ